MEFPGVGVLSLNHPPEELRTYMRNKMKSVYRRLAAVKNGKISWDDFKKNTEKRVSENYSGDQVAVNVKAFLEIFDYFYTFDGKRGDVTEETYLNAWIDRIYASPEHRKIHMEEMKKATDIYFAQLDLNKDGKISLDEWLIFCKEAGPEIAKNVFEEVDMNKDNVISPSEFSYAIIKHHLCSGPEEKISLMYGPVDLE